MSELRLLTPEQVAEACSVSARTVMRAIKAGELVASQLAARGCWRVRGDDVEAWLEQRANVARERAVEAAAAAAGRRPRPRPLLPAAPRPAPRAAPGGAAARAGADAAGAARAGAARAGAARAGAARAGAPRAGSTGRLRVDATMGRGT